MSSGRERLYNWDDKAIRWYQNAVEYRSFHSDVAEIVISHYDRKPSICDIGCGIGALSVALSDKCETVLGIDINPKPIAFMNEIIADKNIRNVSTVVGDFSIMPPPETKYDAAVFCLAGGVSSFLENGRKWADTLFFIENATNSRSFSTSDSLEKETYYNEDLNYLDDLGIEYEYSFFSAPFGQVFTDMDDAMEFMRFYNSGKSDDEIRLALESRLEEIHSPDYKYYMPNEKPLLIITIHC